MPTTKAKQDAVTADEKTVKGLRSKARALRAMPLVVEEGGARELALAAYEEAAAILEDAAERCRDEPGARF